MSKSKIYTKSGDKGETSLVSGKRISKGNHRIHIYGEVDELNSYLGVIVSELNNVDDFLADISFLQNIQSRLFDLGSNLACEEELREKYKLPQLDNEIIDLLESRIDELDSELPPLKNFILPGGHIIASHIHVGRTICRRIERNLVSFLEDKSEELPINSLEFMNRLSDFLFVFARYVNNKLKEEEIKWEPNS